MVWCNYLYENGRSSSNSLRNKNNLIYLLDTGEFFRLSFVLSEYSPFHLGNKIFRWASIVIGQKC